MDKTDQALASVIEKLATATQSMAGPAYNIVLETARARAFVNLWEIAGSLIVMAAFAALSKFLLLRAQNSDEEQAEDLRMWGRLAMLFGCGSCMIWFVVSLAAAPMNIMVFNHPEVAIGKAILSRMDGDSK